MTSKLYYVHDPMCSWCWGFYPQWQALKSALDERFSDGLVIENLVGGLAKDTDEPMPLAMQEVIQGYWRDVQSQLQTEFNFDFWTSNTPRRATFDACRATIAITFQCEDTATQISAQNSMIEAIQRGYYLRAMNPSEMDVLSQLAQELGFDRQQFEADMKSERLNSEFDRQLKLARALPIDGFPSLVLKVRERHYKIPRDYHGHQSMLSAIENTLLLNPR
ncbi:MAG: DsbA family protein [Cellvibrionaceae bacterium]